MKLQFTPQPYQDIAVSSTCTLLRGEWDLARRYIQSGDLIGDSVGNALPVSVSQIQQNLHAVQRENRLPLTDDAGKLSFCVEMETGTGKTYVYIKTMYELHARYGLSKFVVVVPSIAIREGVKKSFEMTHEHFQTHYGRQPIRWFVYNSARLGDVREFAQSSGIEVMIINIDAFRKSENIIHQQMDRMNSGRAIDLIRDIRPVVIIDEPQSVDNTPKAKEAIAWLNPLFTLRYSATHREKINTLYRLTPVDAYQQGLAKVSIQDYVEAIATRYPLLGMAVLEENSRKAVEQTALQAIKYSLDHRKVYNWAYLAVLLTAVQYAKDWDRAENSGFWAYIAEQFGYKDSPQIYDVLTTAVKTACQSYNRLFVVDPNGDNNYYSTVLVHALSPSKSFYALCEFLVKFYRNNLDCSVYEDDPAIARMVSVLRDRCQGATIEQDEDIRGNIYGVQAGLKALITTRPGYTKHFLTKTLQKIGMLLDGGELPCKEYLNILLTQWYISKLIEPSTSISLTTPTITSALSTKRYTSMHKRTTDIAFTYGRIRVEYVLDDDGEPALRIPSIRLASRNNPIIIIRSDGEDVYQQTVGIYGNDYAATSEEVIIPLVDICDADFTRLDAAITIDGKHVFSSGSDLRIKALLFKDGKLQTGKTIDEGNYTLFAPNRGLNID